MLNICIRFKLSFTLFACIFNLFCICRVILYPKYEYSSMHSLTRGEELLIQTPSQQINLRWTAPSWFGYPALCSGRIPEEFRLSWRSGDDLIQRLAQSKTNQQSQMQLFRLISSSLLNICKDGNNAFSRPLSVPFRCESFPNVVLECSLLQLVSTAPHHSAVYIQEESSFVFSVICVRQLKTASRSCLSLVSLRLNKYNFNQLGGLPLDILQYVSVLF